jgi:hypothetical protein
MRRGSEEQTARRTTILPAAGHDEDFAGMSKTAATGFVPARK